MNIGGIVKHLEDRLALIAERHSIQREIDALEARKKAVDEKIKSVDLPLATEMDKRALQYVSYKNVIYSAVRLGAGLICLCGDKGLTLSEADADSTA